MLKKSRRILTVVIFTALVGALLFPLTAIAGSLEPSAAPAPTMHTLEELYNKMDLIQTAIRFEVVLNGAGVLDHRTGLIWAKSPDLTLRNWYDSSTFLSTLTLGGITGWRMPSYDEMRSLVDCTVADNPNLPAGHPFTNVQNYYYWSSTTWSNMSQVGIFWYACSGITASYNMSLNSLPVWPVHNGQ